MVTSDTEARTRCLADYAVSRENAAKLDLLVSELIRWQRIKNLVSLGDIGVLWTRHIADSIQLRGLSDEVARPWVDLGSGAGFPGLVMAIMLPDTAVHLIDSDHRKCAFLRHMARQVAPNAVVHAGRIEDTSPNLPTTAGTVSARALAPLEQLLSWASPLLQTGATGLFLKGRDFAAELTRARECWRFEADLIPSRTDSTARIIRIRGLGEHMINDGSDP